MTKLSLLIISSLVTAAASAGTISNQRGLDRCIDEIESQFTQSQGLMLSRTSLRADSEAGPTFYLNGHIWNGEGQREAVALACSTSVDGRSVVNTQQITGHYKLSRKEARQIATN